MSCAGANVPVAMPAAAPTTELGVTLALAPSDARTVEQLACAALALGWQMAELYDDPLPAAGARAPAGDEKPHAEQGASRATSETQPLDEHAHEQARRGDLPGISDLTTEEKVDVRVEQIDRGLRMLASALGDAGVANPSSAGVHTALKDEQAPAAVRDAIRRLHVDLLGALTVADYRLGKAYGLGRALCDTCRSPQSDAELTDHLRDRRLDNLIGWCEDLKTVLPAHAGQPVADSLKRWAAWAAANPPGAQNAPEINRRLHRQGERWRAVLSGEKHATDILTPTTYVNAAERLLKDAASMAGHFLVKFVWLMLVAVVLLVVGIAVISGGGANNLVAGLASIATSLGITWKTATPALTNVARKVGHPLWEAELDAAITTAITDPTVLPATSNRPRIAPWLRQSLPGASHPWRTPTTP
jgi:hypothetical protein